MFFFFIDNLLIIFYIKSVYKMSENSKKCPFQLFTIQGDVCMCCFFCLKLNDIPFNVKKQEVSTFEAKKWILQKMLMKNASNSNQNTPINPFTGSIAV